MPTMATTPPPPPAIEPTLEDEDDEPSSEVTGDDSALMDDCDGAGVCVVPTVGAGVGVVPDVMAVGLEVDGGGGEGLVPPGQPGHW